MKSIVLSLVIIANMLFVSCAKTRTCSCKTKTTTTTEFIPRSIAQPSTSIRTVEGGDEYTVNKIKKSEMKKLYGCNSRKETSINSYTIEGSVATATTNTGGFTTYISTSYTADVVSTNVDEFTCEIK